MIKISDSNKFSSSGQVGRALKVILERMKNTSINEETELKHICINCKYRHGVEGYDQQWGMTYCVHNWCDKDRTLMDDWERNNKHFIEPCEYFEAGEMRYDKISEKEKRRLGI